LHLGPDLLKLLPQLMSVCLSLGDRHGCALQCPAGLAFGMGQRISHLS
jgi:hypothetical protein